MERRVNPVRRRRGYTRLSPKHQVTLPAHVVAAVQLEPGDELKVAVEADGRIVLTREQSLAERRRRAIDKYAGTFDGVYEPGYLDRLRDEWR